MSQDQPSHEAGFTLIEILIAAALFALIGLAGFTLVSTIIGVQRRTDQRLDVLADRQRAMHILTSDLEQAEPGSITLAGPVLGLKRSAPDGGAVAVRYGLAQAVFTRTIGGASGDARDQPLLPNVERITWHFFVVPSGWQDALPEKAKGLAGIALELTFATEPGTPSSGLRRVVAVPRLPAT